MGRLIKTCFGNNISEQCDKIEKQKAKLSQPKSIIYLKYKCVRLKKLNLTYLRNGSAFVILVKANKQPQH